MSESKTFTVLPPAPDLCQVCAVEHEPDQPHDATSLFYGIWFAQQYGRSPTWADAMAHCTDEVKAAWEANLAAVGVDINSTNTRGLMA